MSLFSYAKKATFFIVSSLVLWPCAAFAMDQVLVGSQTCAACHVDEAKAWTSSHHHDAMLDASEQSVKGDFDNAALVHDGVTTQFKKNGSKFVIRTPDAAGEMQDHPVRYTFGVAPLQQYIIGAPGGRLQMFTAAWDTRAASEGGQRWFDLYPGEQLGHGDSLHWSGIDQNWNHMCSDCHSTNVRKNYDPDTRSFATIWSEVNVGCESCHGGGKRHLEWLNDRTTEADQVSADNGNGKGNDRDLDKGFDDRLQGQNQLHSCAGCHARRTVLREGVPGRGGYLASFLPTLLSTELYHADGNVRDEVFVYGSFLQSKKHKAGVICSDCHEPHSLKLHHTGNKMCLSCHSQETYQSAQHHFHPVGSEAAQCVACHMPTTTFMQIDARRDHRFSIPQPDISERIGSPDACTQCHTQQTGQWAAAQLLRWYGKRPDSAVEHPALTLHQARQNGRVAPALATLAMNINMADIVRATAASELKRYNGPNSVAVLKQLLQSDSDLVRLGAIEGLETADGVQKRTLLWPLLQHPSRAVRHSTTRLLASVRMDQLTDAQRPVLEKAFDEYLSALRRDSDRPEAALAIARFYIDQGNRVQAQAVYRSTLQIHPMFAPAYINLADLYRAVDEDAKGKSVLLGGLSVLPDNADMHHALGLAYIRDRQLTRAIGALKQATTLDSKSSRYQYVYALALDAVGKQDDALQAMEHAHELDRLDTNVIVALVTWLERAGQPQRAARLRQLLEK